MKTTVCIDCAGAPINHTLEKLSVTLDYGMLAYLTPVETLRKTVETAFAKLKPRNFSITVVNLFVRIKVLKLVDAPRITDNYRTRVLWESAPSRGIAMYGINILNFPTQLFMAHFQNQKQVFLTLPRPQGAHSDSLEWMDNKAIMKSRFITAGIPVANGKICFSKASALNVFRQLNKPVIVKPILGSRSRHTTIHIQTETELFQAVTVAKKISPWVIVEEELIGAVYRATVIGGKLFAVLRRDPPFVVGDGTNNVKDLVEKENNNPIRKGPIFHEITVDEEALAELARQGLSLSSIPQNGQKVTLNQKVGRGSGGSNTDVTDQVHPDNDLLFEKIGHVLADPLVGVDFIISDISQSWRLQDKCGVIECNAMPFIDLHHYPGEGQSRDAAGALWDVVFPQTIQYPE